MKITTFSDYALRILIYLAIHEGEKVTVTEISSAYDISFHHAAKATQWLSRAGYVKSERGRFGGVALNKPASAINIAAIIKATESGSHMVDCLRESGGSCCISPACGLQQALSQAQDAFYGVLEQFSLADISSKKSALRNLFAAIP